VVHQSKKKKKIVQPAEAKTPEENSSLAAVQDGSEEQTEAVDVPVMPFDISQVDPAKIELAEKMGIPIKQLIDWAASVEARFAIIQKDIADAPEAVVAALKAEAVKRQPAAGQPMQQQGGQPQQGSGGKGDLGAVLQLLSGSGGSNPLQEKMMNAMFEKTMMGMDLSNALTKAMIIKLAPELAGELTKALVKSG